MTECWKPYREGGWLVVVLPTGDMAEGRVVRLTKLVSGEGNLLARGRFRRFRHASRLQEYHRVDLKCRDAPRWSGALIDWFEPRLDWIEENVGYDWYFHLSAYVEDVDKTFVFLFRDIRDAVHFSLRWCGEDA